MQETATTTTSCLRAELLPVSGLIVLSREGGEVFVIDAAEAAHLINVLSAMLAEGRRHTRYIDGSTRHCRRILTLTLDPEEAEHATRQLRLAGDKWILSITR